MGGLMRRRGASQRHHSCRGRRCDRSFAGLAGLVAQQAFDPGLGVALLPAPYRRAADSGVRRDPLRRFSLGRGENDARPVHMLSQLVAVTRNRLQPLGMLREAFRVLRRAGRIALYNMCPQESDDWLYYAYFPEAKTRDFADFWPPDAIVSELSATGFTGVEV